MLVLLGLEEAKRDALLAPTKCELGISEVPQSRDPHFPNSAIRNSKSPIPIRISQIPQFEIRNSQFEIPNPQSLSPLVFWVFALQFLFDLWIVLFPEV